MNDFEKYKLAVNYQLERLPEDEVLSTLKFNFNYYAEKLDNAGNDKEVITGIVEGLFWNLAQLTYYLNINTDDILL